MTTGLVESTLYDVCNTKVERPSPSLVKRICYPHTNKVHSDAVNYGRENEGNALASYKSLALEWHGSMEFRDAGFLISQKYIFLGATPDMLVKCSRCGEGNAEVKCPWSARGRNLADLVNEMNSCVAENGSILEPESNHLSLLLLPVAQRFFRKALLPELVDRVFTRPNDSRPPAINGCAPTDGAQSNLGAGPTQVDKSDQYCLCKGPEEGKMIACNGPCCP